MNKYISSALIVVSILFSFYLLVSFTPIGKYEGDIIYLTKQHLVLVAVSGSLAIVFGILTGILLSRRFLDKQAENLMQIFNMSTTIPTLAILALSMSFLGIGFIPSIAGLFIATLLPIIKNTFVGLKSVSADTLEVARGIGMSPMQVLFQVEIPNALYVIFAGVRTAISINVGTTPLVFLIGGGGLGDLIFSGIDLDIMPMLLAGAITTAILAIIIDKLLYLMSFTFISKGVIPENS